MAISPTLTGNGAPQIATFDHNVLGAFYSSGVSLGMNGHAAKIQDELLNGSFANVDPAIIPPWTIPESRPYDQMLQRIFSSGPLIDLSDPRVNNTAGDDQFKNLFGLFTGLTKLREMATYAEEEAGASTRATLLQRRFEGYLDEVKGFVSDLAFEGSEPDQSESNAVIEVPWERWQNMLFLQRDLSHWLQHVASPNNGDDA